MTVLNLTFLAPAVLAVQLVASPVLALEFQQPQQLAVELAQETPVLLLQIRAPQLLDAALLPVLIGPPGVDGGALPNSPAFTYAAGRLVGVVYADGSTKTMTWAGEQLAQVDFARVGRPTTRKTLAYNLDGTLASVTEAVI